MELVTYGGNSYKFSEVPGVIKIEELKFVEDDLNQLVSLGLLILNYNNEGVRIFKITRATVKLLEQNQVE